jgi:hypothetical protein
MKVKPIKAWAIVHRKGLNPHTIFRLKSQAKLNAILNGEYVIRVKITPSP